MIKYRYLSAKIDSYPTLLSDVIYTEKELSGIKTLYGYFKDNYRINHNSKNIKNPCKEDIEEAEKIYNSLANETVKKESRVLIVDDNYHSLMYPLLNKQFKPYQFIFAADEEDAKNKIFNEMDNNTGIDLVILDVFLKNTDIQPMLNALKYCLKWKIPVILFTGGFIELKTNGWEEIIKMRKGGVVEIVEKGEVGEYDNAFVCLNKKIRKVLETTSKATSKGILITHGTDTMAWTHEVLRYALKNMTVNIVLTGSQTPLSESIFFSSNSKSTNLSQKGHSDAIENIVNSLKIISGLIPKGVYVVFNNGRDVFNSDIQKIDKWKNEAYVGNCVCNFTHADIETLNDNYYYFPKEMKTDDLTFIKAGGTISATMVNGTAVQKKSLSNVGCIISELIEKYLKRENLKSEKITPIEIWKINNKEGLDSSQVNIDHYRELLKTLESIKDSNFEEEKCLDYEVENYLEYVDKIKVIRCDPFKNKDDYIKECENALGAIFIAYGAGNVTDIPTHSPSEAMQELKKKEKNYVIASQVPFNTMGFTYDLAKNAIEKWKCLPSGNFSIQRMQMKMAYIEWATKDTKDVEPKNIYVLKKLAYLSGMSFDRVTDEILLIKSLKSQFNRDKRDNIFILNDEDILARKPKEEWIKEIKRINNL